MRSNLRQGKSKTPDRQKSRKEIRRETNQTPTTVVEESSDDESKHYELNFETERQPELQTDHSAESVSEDIAWESGTVSDRGEGEDGCSADEEQEHHPPLKQERMRQDHRPQVTLVRKAPL